jgi:septal ring factor EnvC (AmiA/AmiB activator)
MDVLSVVVAVISGVVLPTSLFLIARATKRTDEREKARDARLNRMERSIGKHTKALSRMASAQQLLLESRQQTINEIEELEDATQQLQLATHVLRERMDTHKTFHEQLTSNERGPR